MNVRLPRFLFVVLAVSRVAVADNIEALTEKWVSRYSVPGTLNNQSAATAADANGDLYVASYVETTPSYYRAAITKLSATTGALLWQWQSTFQAARSEGSSGAVYGVCNLAIGPDGNPVAIFIGDIVKLGAADGRLLWSIGGLGVLDSYTPSQLGELAFDPSGDVLVAGARGGGRVRKYDRQAGRVLWDRLVSGTVWCQTIKTDATGNIYVAGRSSAQQYKPCTLKLSPEGVIMWSKTETDLTVNDMARLLVLDSTGDVVVATYGGRLYKYRNSDGMRVWSAAVSASPKDLLVDPAGDVYVITGQGSHVAKFVGGTGVRAWQTTGDPVGAHKVTLLLRGDQLLVYGSSSYGLILAAVDRQNGALRWYQQYTSPFPTWVNPVATTGTMAVKLMALQPDAGVIVAGAARRSRDDTHLENVILRYGPGPTVGKGGTDWVLPTRAQLKAPACGNFFPTEIFWEYGLTTAYGNTTPRQPIVEAWKPYSSMPIYRAVIEGLADNTPYHARAVVVSSRGISVSADFTFTTGWDADGDKLPDEWELEKWGHTGNGLLAVDSDLDGTNNLLEYALDRHPLVGDAAIMPPAFVDSDGHLSMTVTKRPHVTLEVEASTNLVLWVPAVIVEEDATSFTAREEFSPSTPGGRFLRIRATTK